VFSVSTAGGGFSVCNDAIRSGDLGGADGADGDGADSGGSDEDGYSDW
jgi:hypothetical protein